MCFYEPLGVTSLVAVPQKQAALLLAGRLMEPEQVPWKGVYPQLTAPEDPAPSAGRHVAAGKTAHLLQPYVRHMHLPPGRVHI